MSQSAEPSNVMPLRLTVLYIQAHDNVLSHELDKLEGRELLAYGYLEIDSADNLPIPSRAVGCICAIVRDDDNAQVAEIAPPIGLAALSVVTTKGLMTPQQCHFRLAPETYDELAAMRHSMSFCRFYLHAGLYNVPNSTNLQEVIACGAGDGGWTVARLVALETTPALSYPVPDTRVSTLS